MKQLSALLAALAMALTLCACGGGDAAPSPSESAAPSESTAPAESADPSESPAEEADLTQALFAYASGLPGGDNDIMVDGAPTSSDLYFYQVASACAQLGQYGITDFSDEQFSGYIVTNATSALAYFAALRSMAEESGVLLTGNVRAELFDQLDEDLAGQGMTREQLYGLTGLSEADFFYVYSSSWLYDSLMESLVPRPSQAELEAYGEDNGIFSCKHILLNTVTEDQTGEDGTVTSADDYNAARKALAEDLLSRIQAEGDAAEALLDQLAAEYSEDPGLATNPDGYTFTDSDSLVDGFREGTLALSVGEVGLVETSYGYHIILRKAPDLEQYSDTLREEQLYTQVQQRMDAADVQLSEALQSVDLTDFYSRVSVWRAAYMDREGLASG